MISRKKLQKVAIYTSNILIALLAIRVFVFPIFEIENNLVFNLSIFILALLLAIVYQYDYCCTYKNIENNTKGKLLIILISLIIWITIFVVFYFELYRFL